MPTYRLGTTSYILPDDILPNVRFLADRVDDIELVLFEIGDGGLILPPPAVIEQLALLGAKHGLSYTVHLPLDLRMVGKANRLHHSLEKARKVIERTAPLIPWAYVLHLDGKESYDYEAWVEQAVRSLELVGSWAGDPGLLAVENLEKYPLDFIDPVLARVPVSRCVDVGHLWLEGHDPLAYLDKALPRTRVVHLHGIGTRDHQSLAHQAPEQVEAVLNWLRESSYAGVLTLEVFGQDDFESSLAVVQRQEARWVGG